ncbi:hypothetical protein DYB28_005877 [Aphanomyces astaci]|uniref:Uncharacterized protein n=1 Tax=Aphanomyces astaci TaxID=112090 RepID=A0A9X8H869_APHAT|nr:hypothetical protein DYB28_005877 [Aphanomyces astaci]
MPRSKSRKPRLAATKDIGEVFDSADLPVKLSEDPCVSDTRNTIQEIIDLLIHRNDQIEELIEGVLDRKFQVYHKARKIKAEASGDQSSK